MTSSIRTTYNQYLEIGYGFSEEGACVPLLFISKIIQEQQKKEQGT